MDLIRAYDVLGVAVGSTEPVAKSAYRKLRGHWHTDHNPASDARERFDEVLKAFAAIRDAGFPDGDALKGLGLLGPRAVGGGTPSGKRGDAWKQAAPRQSEAQASDASANEQRAKISRAIRLSLEEAAHGSTQSLKGKYRTPCTACNGAKTGLARFCEACSGSGFRRNARMERDGMGNSFPTYSCAMCNGEGKLKAPCMACAGSGLSNEFRPYEVQFRTPPGMAEGQELLVRTSGGGHLRSEMSLEIVLRVEIKEHDIYWFDSDGVLSCSVPVGMLQIMAEEEIEVPTLWGKRMVRLVPGVRVLELPNAGFPSRTGERGRMRVMIQAIETAVGEPYLSMVRSAVQGMRASGMQPSREERQFAKRVSKAMEWVDEA